MRWIQYTLLLICSCIFFVTVTNAAQTSDTALASRHRQITVWIDAAHIDMTDPKITQSVLSLNANRYIITCFENGRCLFADDAHNFAPFSGYQNKQEWFPAFIAHAQANHATVFAYMDCLRWFTDSESPLNLKHRALIEKTKEGECMIMPGEIVASPFDPAVRDGLHHLTDQLARRYPTLNGLVLRCSLPLGVVTGYSDAARAEYIRANQVDPIDLVLTGDHEQMARTGQWVNWRYAQIFSLINDISTTFRQHIPAATIVSLGYMKYYKLSPGMRNTSLEDWLQWLKSGAINEIILQDLPGTKFDADLYTTASDLANKVTRTPTLWYLVNVDAAKAGSLPPESDQSLPNLVFRINSLSDMDSVSKEIQRAK